MSGDVFRKELGATSEVSGPMLRVNARSLLNQPWHARRRLWDLEYFGAQSQHT